jgi:hypothetical protein
LISALLNPIIKNENHYAYELPSGQINSNSFPISEVKPLIELSYNYFRGEPDLVNANLLSDIYEELGIEQKSLLQLMREANGNLPIEAYRWQNAYTSGVGRRRYKTTSEGFTLKIRKDVLLKYLSDKSLVLCYDIKLRRSTTKHRPEDYMEWYDLKKRVEAKLA